MAGEEEEIDDLIEKLGEILKKKPDDNDTWLCCKFIPFIRKHQTYNLLHNYNWRAKQIESIIKRKWSGFKISTKPSGPDSWNMDAGEYLPKLNNIEIKTVKDKRGEFQFDKQTDPQRRKETLEYDGFIFGMFSEHEELRWFLMGVESETVSQIRKLLEHEQEAFISEKEAKKEKKMKLGRDNIGLDVKKILSLNEVKWNFFMNGEWKVNVEGSEISLESKEPDKKEEKVTRCGFCREHGHNKRTCPKKITK